MGIRIDAHRDGIFLFDFTGWPEGKPIGIPAYTLVGGQRLVGLNPERHRRIGCR